MSSTRFIAILPQTMQAGDKVQIKGKVNDNAEEFSINFVNETSGNPQNITYHFKWILAEEIIVEDYKENGIWMNNKQTQFDSFDGRFPNRLMLAKKATTNNDSIASNGFLTTNSVDRDTDTDAFTTNSNSYSILGPAFALEFAFLDDGIYVYLVYEDGHNLITHFQPEFELSDIESVQVWGDVEKITQLSFFYN